MNYVLLDTNIILDMVVDVTAKLRCHRPANVGCRQIAQLAGGTVATDIIFLLRLAGEDFLTCHMKHLLHFFHHNGHGA